MVKEYFSHDYSTRSDQKIKRVIIKYGMQGYGIYWGIIEMLYQNDNNLIYDTDLISYELRESESMINSILSDFDLFEIENGFIKSSGVTKRLQIRDSKSTKGQSSANKRWADGNQETRKKAQKCIFYVLKIYNSKESFIKVGITTESVSRRYSGKLNGYEYELIFSHDEDLELCLKLENNISNKFSMYLPEKSFAGYLECFDISNLEDIINFAMQHFDIPIAKYDFRNAIKETKGKKEKKIKQEEINISCFSFLDFWSVYPNKTSKADAEKRYVKLNESDREIIKKTIKSFIENKPFKEYNHPMASTYINQKRWLDEVPEKIQSYDFSKISASNGVIKF